MRVAGCWVLGAGCGVLSASCGVLGNNSTFEELVPIYREGKGDVGNGSGLRAPAYAEASAGKAWFRIN